MLLVHGLKPAANTQVDIPSHMYVRSAIKDCGIYFERTYWLSELCGNSGGNAQSEDASNGDDGDDDDTEVNVDDDDDDDDDDGLVMTVMRQVRWLGCSALQCWRLWVQ